MKALVKPRPGPGLELLDVSLPQISPHDVLVRVRIAGICGTDMHIYAWDHWSAGRVNPPIIPGHEFVGEVAEVGEAVTTVRVGDYVSGECHIPCGKCYQCRTGSPHICQDVKVCGIDRDGAWAEYIALPEASIWKLDAEIPIEMAAIFDPLGNAVHTVLSGDVAAQTVAVIGCGPIGLAAIAVARAAGATSIYAADVWGFRLEVARRMGADLTINSTGEDAVRRLRGETGGNGVDVALEMSGQPEGLSTALGSLRSGGRLAILGLPKDPVLLDVSNDIVLKGITIQGIHGRKMFGTWYQLTRLIKSGRVDFSPIITHRMRLSEFESAVEAMKDGRSGKVLLYP